VLSRHLAKSPGSWASRRFLLGQCDAFVAVSEFVAKVLKEGHADPSSDNPERHYRAPMLGDHSKIHVVYGGFDMSRFQPAETSLCGRNGASVRSITLSGWSADSISPWKRQPEFLEAAKHVHSSQPQRAFSSSAQETWKASCENR